MASNWDDAADDFDDADQDACDEDDAVTVVCPQCGTDVFEDAPCCPACGHYFTSSTSVWSGQPWWWIALGVVGVAAAIAAALLAVGG